MLTLLRILIAYRKSPFGQMQDDKRLISLLLKMFSMFEIRLSYGEEDLDTVSLKCINCKRETGLDPKPVLLGCMIKSSLNLC